MKKAILVMLAMVLVVPMTIVSDGCAQIPPPASSGPIIMPGVSGGDGDDLAMWSMSIGWYNGFSGISLVNIGGPLTRDQIRRNYQLIASTPTTDVLAYQTMWFVVYYNPSGIAKSGVSLPRY